MVKVQKKEGSFDHAIALSRWSMKMLSIWPEDGRCLTTRYFLIFTLSCGLFVHPYFYTLNDRNIPMDVILVIFGSIPIFSKFFFAKLKLKSYDIIIKRMAKDWDDFCYLSENNKRIMTFYGRKARRMNVVCIACTTLSYFVYVLGPIYEGTNNLRLNVTLKKLPTEGWFPFDVKQSPLFEVTYVIQMIQSFFLAGLTLATDSFLCVVVLHACGQLAVLSKIIKNYTGIIKHSETGKINKINKNNKECACLSCIVKNHVSLIEYINIIEDSFSGLILFQLLGNSFLLSVEGYLFVVHAKKNDVSGIVTYIVYAIGATYSLFIYCYLGEYIIEQAENIRNTAYNVKWYKFASYSASPLILLIRSGYSCKITAGRFSVMRLSYYKKIIMTSLSYISVLKAVK